MIRNQLTVCRAAVMAACLTLAAASGCKSQQTAFYNPFQSAPDKVPPPSTRTLLPGQAAPYYPGDPLPSMQSASRQPAAAVTGANPTAVAAAAKAATPAPQPAQALASRPTALASNEGSIAVPTDGDSLRFALPKAAPATVVAAAPQQVQPTTQLGVATQSQPVSLASFDQSAPMNGAASASPGWRSPNVARQTVTQAPTQSQTLALGPPPSGPQFVGAPAPVQFAPQSIVAPASTMPVTLRPVSSPPMEQVASPTPRIRISGSDVSPTAVAQAAPVQSGPVQQAAYYYSPTTGQPVAMQPMPGTVVQTVQVTPLAANMYSPAVAATNPSDGFRPRGSMR